MTAFQFVETMAGSYHLLDRPEDERPMSFTIRARSKSLARFFAKRVVDIEGEVDAEGFADHCELRGTLGLDVLVTRTLPYTFEFTANDGRRYRFSGQKDVRATRLLGSMTRLPGSILDHNGHEIGRAELRFDLRGDIVSFLKSWKSV